ncbi:unnamed protein product [Prunus armeniaca]|uniref:Uncharacterized protein n=1 Tax=Prunus armeniaca TaxID=36596 RepID=A0A6J5UDN3_PRUAR|nr:unnamed protein product [Prunus armeniaca]
MVRGVRTNPPRGCEINPGNSTLRFFLCLLYPPQQIGPCIHRKSSPSSVIVMELAHRPSPVGSALVPSAGPDRERVPLGRARRRQASAAVGGPRVAVERGKGVPGSGSGAQGRGGPIGGGSAKGLLRLYT